MSHGGQHHRPPAAAFDERTSRRRSTRVDCSSITVRWSSRVGGAPDSRFPDDVVTDDLDERLPVRGLDRDVRAASTSATSCGASSDRSLFVRCRPFRTARRGPDHSRGLAKLRPDHDSSCSVIRSTGSGLLGGLIGCWPGTTIGTTNSSSIARSSSSSWPGKISSDVITRTSQRARRSTTSGSSGRSDSRNACGERLDDLRLLGHLRADRALSAVANHDDSAGLSRTRRSDVSQPGEQPFARVGDPGDLLGHLLVAAGRSRGARTRCTARRGSRSSGTASPANILRPWRSRSCRRSRRRCWANSSPAASRMRSAATSVRRAPSQSRPPSSRHPERHRQRSCARNCRRPRRFRPRRPRNPGSGRAVRSAPPATACGPPPRRGSGARRG